MYLLKFNAVNKIALNIKHQYYHTHVNLHLWYS